MAREVKNRKESLDKTKQTLKDIIKEDTDQYYKAGISAGEFGKAGIQGEAEQSYEVGYDVSQDKIDKVADIATVIKDLLVEMKEQQKIQTEVQRESMKQGLL